MTPANKAPHIIYMRRRFLLTIICLYNKADESFLTQYTHYLFERFLFGDFISSVRFLSFIVHNAFIFRVNWGLPT